MKSLHGNINPSSNSVLKDLKIDSIKEYFTKHSMINENFQDEKKERLSILKTKKNIKQYGHIPAFVINPFSSDEESDIEDEKLNEATIRDVSNILLDLNTIMTVRNFEEFPKEARPAVLLQNMDEWITPSYVKQFVEDCPVFLKDHIHPIIEEVKIIRYKILTFALVIFQKISDCKMFFKYLDNPVKKKKAPTKNFKGTQIEAYIAYDLLDLTLSNWYGVVLRNLPNNSTQVNVKSFCENHVNGVLYALFPIKIKTSYCSIVILKELDDAEKLCVAVNNKEVGKNKKIKAHIHPRCCKIRRNAEKSHYLKLFVNNKIVFNKTIKDSSNLVSSSTPLTKLKIFQGASKIESETLNNTNTIVKDSNTSAQSNQNLINLLIKSPDNSKSNILPANEKVNSITEKNSEKPNDKDMYTSLLTMLSIPPSNSKIQEKELQLVFSSADNNISKFDKISSQIDNTFRSDDLNNMNSDNKLPFINNLNPLITNENVTQLNLDSNKSRNLVHLPNKELNATKNNKKSSNNTMQMMSNIGKMLELINKSQFQSKSTEIPHQNTSQEKIEQKSQKDFETNMKELTNFPKETINNDFSIKEDINLDNEKIVISNLDSIKCYDKDSYDKEMEEINDLEYITYDFKDISFYETPRQRNHFSKFRYLKPEISEKADFQEQSKFKKFYNPDNRNNFDLNNKFPNYKNYSEQIEVKDKDKEFSSQINKKEIKMNNQSAITENSNQTHFTKNRNYNKKIDRNYTYNSNYNKNFYSNNNTKRIYSHNNNQNKNEISEENINNKQSNISTREAVNIELSESTNIEMTNISDTNKLIEQNQNISETNTSTIQIEITTSDNKPNCQIALPTEEVLPPLPTSQPPEPEIRIPTSSESVVLIESNEEPGQIVLSSTEEDKYKSDKKISSSTNSDDIEDRRYIRRKRSRSRDRYKDDYYDYKGNNRRYAHNSRENVDKGNYQRKESTGYKGEYKYRRDHNNYGRYHRDNNRDNFERKSFKDKNKSGKIQHKTHSRSSSLSSKDLSDKDNGGFYMKKFFERSKHHGTNSNAPNKYHFQKGEENLDSREKHFKYK